VQAGFGPNAVGWQQQYAAGNPDATIATGQAPEMMVGGRATAGTLQDYYARMNANPPYPSGYYDSGGNWVNAGPWAGIY
jgi:hypothetical protein